MDIAVHYILARITVKPEAAETAEIAKGILMELLATPHVGAAIAAAPALFAMPPEILAFSKLA